MRTTITIRNMQDLAARRGGRCLSKKYTNMHTKLWWKCAKGHKWDATPDSIKRGNWCRRCGREKSAEARKLGIEVARQLAKERGGKCLSEVYINARSPLLWQCKEGHQWSAPLDSVKNQGTWCRRCYGTAKLSIEEMHRLAKERGGKCLSKKYVNARTELRWQCIALHKFEKTPDQAKRGGWCPECSTGLGERICRAFFERIFGKKFPRSHPKWLVTHAGNRLEIDGYCKSLGLAFEHHGEQHYSTSSRYITSKKGLRKRQEVDRLKRKLCKAQGIVLIEIPEIPNRLPIAEIKRFVGKLCKRCGVPLPHDFYTKITNLKRAYATSGSIEALRELQEIARKRGGKCLSNTYIDAHTHLLWQCKKGHQWPASPNSVKNSKWCPDCGGTRRLTIEDMHRIARRHGGKFLSKEYINARTKYLWECKRGHQFKKTADKARYQWCQKCSKQMRIEALQEGRLKCLEEMRKIAKQRGGKCLSVEYLNSKTPLQWECAKGHQWSAIPSSIQSGHWCQKCGNAKIAEARKIGIEKMRQLARKRGGKCLSKAYVNNKTPLLWECAKKHRWFAIPSNVQQGSWCYKCANLRKKGKGRPKGES
jgi:hypothetical protein